MSKLMLGICGIHWGALTAASMIPLEFTAKSAGLIGAFLNRFSTGFVLWRCQIACSCVAKWSHLRCASELGRCHHHEGVSADPHPGRDQRSCHQSYCQQMG